MSNTISLLLFTNNKQYYLLHLLQFLWPHLPTVPGACKKVAKS